MVKIVLGHCIKRCGRDSNWNIASKDIKVLTVTLLKTQLRPVQWRWPRVTGVGWLEGVGVGVVSLWDSLC